MKAFEMPKGEIFVNEVKPENSIAFIDAPDQQDIQELFSLFGSIERLLYVKGDATVIYNRGDYETRKVQQC